MPERDDERQIADAADGHLPDPAVLAEQHPADVADVIEALPPEDAADVLEGLPPETAAHALEEMDEHEAEEVVEDMEPAAAVSALSHMAPDDATDILAELPDEQRARILSDLPAPQRAKLEKLLTYPPESAGGLMSPEVTALPAELTIPEAIEALRRIADDTEQIYYTYVVDADSRLVGVLSLRDLLLARETQRLREVMITKITSVPADMDQEEVARLLTKYGYYALPVVDAGERLIGIVTVDDVVDVIQEEATEDMQLMAGAGADERIDSPPRLILRRRLPWLLINLGTAMAAASVVAAFKESLEKLIALAILMPVVAQIAGNTGAQSLVVVIRSIATGETRGRRLRHLLVREMRFSVLSGLVIGIVAAGIAMLWWEDAWLAAALGVALLACMVVAALSGAAIPWLLNRAGLDPAQSSTVILLTITDIVAFATFLGLGTWIVAARP